MAVRPKEPGAKPEHPQTVGERMDALYDRYGHFCQNNSYYKCYEPATMARIFERLKAMTAVIFTPAEQVRPPHAHPRSRPSPARR